MLSKEIRENWDLLSAHNKVTCACLYIYALLQWQPSTTFTTHTTIFPIANNNNYQATNTSIKLTCLRGEDAETVVPKTTGNDEPGVNSGDKAVASHAHFLAEVVAQVTFILLCAAAVTWCHLFCRWEGNGNFSFMSQLYANLFKPVLTIELMVSHYMTETVIIVMRDEWERHKCKDQVESVSISYVGRDPWREAREWTVTGFPLHNSDSVHWLCNGKHVSKYIVLYIYDCSEKKYLSYMAKYL